MVIGKRGQFFLLAAVIISVVVISLGAVTNRATVSKDPSNFADFSYEVEREVGAVLDYAVYSGFDDDANLTEFVGLLADEISNKDPEANFMFIYGDEGGMVVKDYAKKGKKIISNVCVGEGVCKYVAEDMDEFDEEAGEEEFDENDLKDRESINVSVEGNDFSFQISKYKQVIFIIQKGVDDESFVSVG